MTKSAGMRVALGLFLVLSCSSLVLAIHDSCQQPEKKEKDDDAPLLAITACTGEVGRRVLTALREVYPANRLRCIVREGTSKPLDHLKDLESVHRVNFMETKSLKEALKGVSAAYLNSPPSHDVLAMRKNMADACVANKETLNHIVLLGEAATVSWYGLTSYWDDHKAGEDAIQATGIPLTILHPAVFMESFGTHFGNPQTIVGADFFVRVGTAPVAYTSVEDLGVVTAKIFKEGPKVHGWKSYDLVNDVLTGEEVAVAMSKALGRRIEYKSLTVEEFRAGLVEAGLPGVYVDAYTLVMAKTADGSFAYDDRGQLESLLGRKPVSMVEAMLNLKPILSKE